MKRFFLPIVFGCLIGLMGISTSCIKATPQHVDIAHTDLVRLEDSKAVIFIGHMSSSAIERQMDIIESRQIKHLTIRIFSMGGAIGDMFAIIDRLERFKSNGGYIVTESNGGVASAAVPIFLMGNERYLGKHSIVMIHPHSVYDPTLETGPYYKNIKDLPTTITLKKKMSETWNKWYAEILARETNLTFEEAMKYVTTGNSQTGQWWFTAEEAIKMGIAHGYL